MPRFHVRGLFAVVLMLAAGGVQGAGPAGSGSTDLRFVRNGRLVRTLDLATLRRDCRTEVVRLDDPYYQAEKSFQACPLRRVLELGFGSATAIADQDVLLRARDGYVKPASGARLLEDGAYLAFADARLTGDGPVDHRSVSQHIEQARLCSGRYLRKPAVPVAQEQPQLVAQLGEIGEAGFQFSKPFSDQRADIATRRSATVALRQHSCQVV